VKQRAALIVVAAGQGQRFGSPTKVLAEVDGAPAISISSRPSETLPPSTRSSS
jgi:CTP:molybdopterin cytidylyltransferase MocA